MERYAFAKSLAHRAGSRALEWFRRRGELTIDLKGPQDFVTHADREVQALIEREIAGAFPGDAFLGEETAPAFRGPLDHCWIVDPIDGTHNFLRGVPYWNIAIAYTESGRTRFGVVYDPVHNELYCARRGEGAMPRVRAGDCDCAARVGGAGIKEVSRAREPTAVTPAKNHNAD